MLSRLSLSFVACSLVLVGFIYWPGLDAGFFLDDTTSIRDPVVMTSDDPSPLIKQYPMRAVGYFTFWANYKWFGEAPEAFRVVNLLIHWLAGVFVFIFCRRILTLQSATSQNNVWIAGLAAALFLIHPLQTGAVTYIVQRLASLAALFSIMSLMAWLYLRTTNRGIFVKACFLTGFVSTLFLAINTKQNAFTLIPIIVLLEILVLRGISVRLLGLAIALLVVMGSIVAVLNPELLEQLDAMTREAHLISRWDYFSHQWVVLFIYLQKLLWPAPLMLEYGYDTNSFSLALRGLAGVGHLLLIVGSLWLSRRAPLVTFGVLFFYIAHSVESGVIPIRDLVFEHRNYFPMVGISVVVAASLSSFANQYETRHRQLIGGCLIVLTLLSATTYQRNELWNNPEAFLKHDVVESGGAPRAMHNLASWYQNDGQFEKALATMRALLKVNEGGLSLTHTTTYIAVLLNVGLFSEVLDLTEKLLERASNNYERAIMLRYMGTAFTGLADDQAAVDTFEDAMRTLQLDYDSGLAYGYSLIQVGRVADAFAHIRSMRQRFGDREKLGLLAKEADRALMQQRASQAAGVPTQ